MGKQIRSEKLYRFVLAAGMDIEPDLSEGSLQAQHEYDLGGNLVLEINYNSDGSISDKNTFEYDEAGRMTRSTIYDEEGEVLESRSIIWNGKGDIEKEEITYMDGSVDTINYAYRDNVLVEKEQLTDDGEMESRESFEYEGEKLVTYEKYNEDGDMVYQVKNTYADGIIRESQVLSAEEEEPSRQVIIFNEAGRRTEEKRYDRRDRLTAHNRFEEDSNGRIVTIIEEDRSRKNTTVMDYDENGKVTRQQETDLNGKVISLVFRNYDEAGLPSTTRVQYTDRMTGMTMENLLVYDYEFFT